MALRSQIGSSLVAKSAPASPIRKTEEANINNPAIPGKGDTGTLSRRFVEDPFLKQTPEGSARVVSVTPGSEAAGQSSVAGNAPAPTPAGGIVPGVGQPGGGAAPAPALRSGASNQALFQGGMSPAVASAPGKAGITAKSTSVSAPSKGAIKPQGQITPTAASTYNAPNPQDTVGSFFAGLPNLGNRVAAADPNAKGGTIPKNLTQAIVATLSPAGSKGEAWATDPNVTKKGTGSVQSIFKAADKASAPVVNALYNIPGVLRSISQSKPAQAAKAAVNKLRSLLGTR